MDEPDVPESDLQKEEDEGQLTQETAQSLKCEDCGKIFRDGRHSFFFDFV